MPFLCLLSKTSREDILKMGRSCFMHTCHNLHLFSTFLMAFPPVSICSMTTTDYIICEAQHKMRKMGLLDKKLLGISRLQKQSIKPSVGSLKHGAQCGCTGSMPKKLILIQEASFITSDSFHCPNGLRDPRNLKPHTQS